MRRTSTRRSRVISRKRPQLMTTIAADVHDELHRRAAATGAKLSSVTDAALRIGLGMLPAATPAAASTP
jgi:hypothetical protein